MSASIESLAKVSEFWLSAGHPLREETIKALMVSTGMRRDGIEMAITNCFGELKNEHLEHWVTRHPVYGLGGTVLHVLPSNAFTAWVHGAVISLMSGWKVFLKPSFREPVFAKAWQRSLRLIDERLAQEVEIVDWSKELLSRYQVVVAYGSDDSIGEIRRVLPSQVPFVSYGHKLSVGIIFDDASQHVGTWLEGAIHDSFPFDLKGCLSPQILYVPTRDMGPWKKLHTTLHSAPKLVPYDRWEEVRRELQTFVPFLSCIGYAGSPEKEHFLIRELKGFSVSRVCPLGEMQRPPLDWRNGGVGLNDVLNSTIGEPLWEINQKTQSIGV